MAYPSLYARTVSIYRPATELAAGDVGFLGHNRATETLLYSGIPASIQAPSIGSRRMGDGKLPDDAPGPIRWNIFIPLGVIPAGAILSRDIIVDDAGARYQVGAAYWNILGWKVQTLRLES